MDSDALTARALDMATFGALLLMGTLGVGGFDTWTRRAGGICLCLIFGALVWWAGRRERSTRTMTVVVAVQAATMIAAVALGSEAYEAFGFMLMELAVRVAMEFTASIAAVWVAGLWIAHTLASPVLRPDAALIIAFNLGVYALCGLVGYTLRRLNIAKAAAEDVSRRLEGAQAMIGRLAVDAERQRLSRDLHDSVKQQVFAASMQIGAASSLLRRDLAAADSALHAAATLTAGAATQLNSVIYELRPDGREEGDLVSALHDVVSEWGRQNALHITLRSDSAAGALALDPDRVHGLTQVVSEALANAVRHSRSDTATVHAGIYGDRLRITVSDEGVGFTPGCASGGLGLTTMHERMSELGGDLRISSRPGTGATVEVALDIARTDDD